MRWSAGTPPCDAHHCHCGMCRRWTGSGFATLVWFDDDALVRHGAPKVFRSSPIAVRAHCGVEGRLAWADIGAGLPGGETREKW